METNKELIQIALPVTSIIKQNDYKYAMVHGHPNATPKGYVLYHRLIMESSLGRYLNRNEIVHHKDGNKDNNDISNLELMSNAEHSRIHTTERTRTKTHLMLEMQCPICGKIFYGRFAELKKSFLKNNTVCCSLRCNVIFGHMKTKGVLNEIQDKIDDSFQDAFYEFASDELNDI